MSLIVDLINEMDKDKQPKKESKVNKFLEFEKQLRDLAKSKGVQPRTFLEQLVKQKPEFAHNKIIQKLIGEQDVPTQKGRDAKPEVLTKRAMNVVKKGIKQAANKQRRRMDKDSVSEDEYDDFSQLINPMGQDSTSLKKIKQSPGFHDMIVTMFASGTQADLEQDEMLHYISKMFNMNTVEIKAILQKDGFDFAEPDAAERFKQNMDATGGIHFGKTKTRTLNSVYEDEAQDRGYAQMIIQQHQNEYKKFMDTGDLMDAPTIYEKLFAYFSSSDADDMMPYGTMKARDGDPYVWLVNKLDELGLIIEEGNEFAQKVRQLKATGAKKGTKFKTSDGEEHTLEQNPQQSKMVGSVSVQQIANQFPEVDDKNQLIQALMKVKQGQKISSLPQVKALAQAFRQMLGMDPMETQQLMTMMKRIETQEDVSDETIDSFHTELYKLVHKYFGHSPDEKREKQKMKEDDQGEVQVGSYQTKHFDICPSATKLYQDIDVEDMDLAERSAKLHDTLFYMEKHAMEMKKADLEYIEMMQNLADQIMAMAGMMGLESEHEYVQSHVDAVKNMKESVTESVAITEQEFDEQAGKKDACYHKVKARYKVWPSAYASGALVQCRKKGAANWGNKSK